jgi:precorrin-4 methylase
MPAFAASVAGEAPDEYSIQAVGGDKVKIDRLAVSMPGIEITNQATTELDSLWKRQEELERKRHHVQRLQAIDSEHASLHRQVNQLEHQQLPRSF